MRDFEGPLSFRNDSFSIDFTTPRAHGTRPTASRGRRVITRLTRRRHDDSDPWGSQEVDPRGGRRPDRTQGIRYVPRHCHHPHVHAPPIRAPDGPVPAKVCVCVISRRRVICCVLCRGPGAQMGVVRMDTGIALHALCTLVPCLLVLCARESWHGTSSMLARAAPTGGAAACIEPVVRCGGLSTTSIVLSMQTAHVFVSCLFLEAPSFCSGPRVAAWARESNLNTSHSNSIARRCLLSVCVRMSGNADGVCVLPGSRLSGDSLREFVLCVLGHEMGCSCVHHLSRAQLRVALLGNSLA